MLNGIVHHAWDSCSHWLRLTIIIKWYSVCWRKIETLYGSTIQQTEAKLSWSQASFCQDNGGLRKWSASTEWCKLFIFVHLWCYVDLNTNNFSTIVASTFRIAHLERNSFCIIAMERFIRGDQSSPITTFAIHKTTFSRIWICYRWVNGEQELFLKGISMQCQWIMDKLTFLWSSIRCVPWTKTNKIYYQIIDVTFDHTFFYTKNVFFASFSNF